MSGSLVGALRVSLGLDSAQFETGLKKARASANTGVAGIMQAFSGIAGTAAKVSAAVAAIGSTAIVMAVRSAADAMDDLSKAAQKTGTSATELSKLQWAAELSDVSAETLQKSLNRLNIAITDIGPGAKGAAGELARLGVTASTGTLDAMMKVADQFAAMPDGAQKSALAIKLFGKAGAEMIPLLNGGAEGLREAAKQATELGLVIDGNTARAAEAFNDNLTTLGKVTEGITMQITAGLVPTLAAMTSELARSAGVGQVWTDVGKAIGNGLVWIAEKAFIAYEAISGITNAVISMRRAAAALIDGKGFAAAGKIIGDQERETKAGIKAREEAFARLRAGIANFKPGETKKTTSNFKLLGSGGQGSVPRTTRTSAPKMGGDFIDPSMREGWALQQLLDAGTPANIDLNNQALQGVAATLGDLKDMDFSLEIIKPEAFKTAERFAENLSSSLSQALVYGQSLGDALVSSFKAAAAELVTSGLMNILLGSKDASGNRSGGLIGDLIGAFLKVPGYANGTNYAPGGLALVGERGRELVQMPRGSRVIPNASTEALMNGGGSAHVTVGVDPNSGNITAFVNNQIAATAPAIAQAGAGIAQGQLAQRAQRRFR